MPYVDLNDGGDRTLRVNYTETVNQDANTSTIKITSFQLKQSFGAWGNLDGYVKVNGSIAVELDSSHPNNSFSYSGGSSGQFQSVNFNGTSNSIVVAHNNDGSGSTNFVFEPTGDWGNDGSIHVNYAYSSGSGNVYGNYWFPKKTISVTLTVIPRASSVSTNVTTIQIGNSFNIVWTPKKNDFKFKWRLTAGSYDSGWSAFVAPGTTSQTSVSATVPTNQSAKVFGGTSSSTTLTVELITYNSSGTQVGSTQSTTLTITLSASDAAPTFTATVTGVSLTGGKYVQNHSKVKVVITATAKYGATISSYSVSIGSTVIGSSANFTSGVLSMTGDSLAIKATVTDSRGNSKEDTIATIKVYSYSVPELTNVTTIRQSSPDTDMKITFSTRYTSLDGSNTVTVKLAYKRRIDSSFSTPTTVTTGQILHNFNISYVYDILYVITDTVGESAEYYDILSTTFTLINFTKNSIAFGKASEIPNTFDCNFQTILEKASTCAEVFMPMGGLGSIPTNPSDPYSEKSTLFIAPWLNESSSATMEQLLRDWIRMCCGAYPNTMHGIFMGPALKGSYHLLMSCIYNTSDVNSSGYPRYSFGWYMSYGNAFHTFGFQEYNLVTN